MSAPAPRKRPKTRKARMDEAFEKACRGIAKDIPLLMHGSVGGGLHIPDSTADNEKEKKSSSPELAAIAARDTQQLIASLTAQYIHRLVDAALDARDMLLFGDQSMYNNIRQLVPPPSIESIHQPRSTATALDVASKNEKRSPEVSCNWDDPLPKPKIRGRPDPTLATRDGQIQASIDSGEEWIGAIGLDIWENDCARASYLQHRCISAQHFIFPLCHDSYVYGRIREIQTMKQNVTEPLLHDTTVLEVVRAEGLLAREEIARKRKRNRRRSKLTKIFDTQRNGDDEDEDDERNESDPDKTNGPTWPGLNYLLPANRYK